MPQEAVYHDFDIDTGKGKRQKKTLTLVDASKKRCLECGCSNYLVVLLPQGRLVGCPSSLAKMWQPLNIYFQTFYFWKFDFHLQLSECLVQAVTGVQSSSAAAKLFQDVCAAPAKKVAMFQIVWCNLLCR